MEQSGRGQEDPPESSGRCVSAGDIPFECTVVEGPSTQQVSRKVQAPVLEKFRDVHRHFGAALKRKRMQTERKAQSSGSDISLVCSEALSSDADSEMGEDMSECESEPKPKAVMQATKRARPSAKKGPAVAQKCLTVSQLKARCCSHSML